jgi:hypothetical protein
MRLLFKPLLAQCRFVVPLAVLSIAGSSFAQSNDLDEAERLTEGFARAAGEPKSVVVAALCSGEFNLGFSDATNVRLIPMCIDYDRCAQWRRPRDMMRHG